MRKQKKQLIVLIVLLLLVALAYMGIRYYNREAEKESEARAEAEKITVTDLSVSDITSFSYLKDGKQLDFRKKGDSWVYEGDPTMDLDEAVIETMLQEAANVIATEEITEYEGLEDYGLEEPANNITLKDGKAVITVCVGNQNEINSRYYIKREDSDTVYLVEAGFVTAFEKSLEELLAKEAETEMPSEGTEALSEGTETPSEGTEAPEEATGTP